MCERFAFLAFLCRATTLDVAELSAFDTADRKADNRCKRSVAAYHSEAIEVSYAIFDVMPVRYFDSDHSTCRMLEVLCIVCFACDAVDGDARYLGVNDELLHQLEVDI